jgi:hypothetical protein
MNLGKEYENRYIHCYFSLNVVQCVQSAVADNSLLPADEVFCDPEEQIGEKQHGK